MKLKKIKAYGFKSFADKIEIDVKDGITGIVGPNGSGKSNIVDAVKWVLGEQSIKALRGSMNMSDVIFQGSKSRKGLARASVSLVIDNEDHYLNTDFKELEIKRTVYNSGENEYYINGSHVRLKDITELFLDSGAGKETFSIISQGKTLEILNSKPVDRRLIIEEAAGILKYKKRKFESLRKLEKSNDNLSKISLVIDELATTLEPLKDEAIKAKKVKELKEELGVKEISILVNDITKLNEEYEELTKQNEILQFELNNLEDNSSNFDSKLEKLKLDVLKLDTNINEKNAKLLQATEEISTLLSSRQVIVERKKYEVDDVKLEDNIIALKETILSLKNDLEKLESDINKDKKELISVAETLNKTNDEYKKFIANKNTLEGERLLKNKLLLDINNKIDILNNNIESSMLLPSSVKSCLDNPRLKGLHGTISKLIDIDEDKREAIDIALGANQNIIVADDEKNIKAAIEFLKDNKLGRATFFPINVIKPKYIKDDILEKIEKNPGFIDIASNCVKYDDKYESIIKNLLGNIIIARDIDSMNKIGKLINYSYRIVTLDGEILHTGGGITGGKKNKQSSLLNEKSKLETLKNNATTLEKEIALLETKLKTLDEKISSSLEEKQSLDIKASIFNETIKSKEARRNVLINDINLKEEELKGTTNIKNSSLDKELDNTLKKYYDALSKKDKLNDEIESLKTKKANIQDEINDLEFKSKKQNSEFNKKNNAINENKIHLGKLDIKLDNLLLRLNEEYNITYEKASKEVSIDSANISSTRSRVEALKREIRSVGEVNLGAIDEYNRINERYTFLSSQKEDLTNSIDDLLGIINEMDETMEKEFKTTFDAVNKEFKKVFAKLFKGGSGEMLLTDPDNLLETGVDIVAEPPGKKLKNINLLSGGEKTLTAIAILFAVLNVKPVPFCILDEVEAALDDANVESFGNYLKDYEDKTQFIVITHKKKTMEYANTLYGITMQESGVSKLVSVKLDNIK